MSVAAGRSLRMFARSASSLASRALELERSSAHGQLRIAKANAIESFRRSPSDTGSPEVQIAALSTRIAHLTKHLSEHKKDVASRRSIVALVNKRRGMMQYLLRKNPTRYLEVVKELGLRPSSVFSKDVPLGAKKKPTPRLH